MAEGRLESIKGRSNLLSVYVTAGFPNLDDTQTLCEAVQSAGADLIEVGIPFSNPIADGPTIQGANQRALANGMTTTLALEQLARIRKTVDIPILMMGHFNPIHRHGVRRFAEDAAAAGVDGLIVPDLPLELLEGSIGDLFAAACLASICLVCPQTSDDRVRRMDAVSGGFLYAVSSPSVTGGSLALDGALREYLARLRSLSLRNPVLVGFGVRERSDFQNVCELANGAIVGSAFLRALEYGPGTIQANAHAFVSGLRRESAPI